MNPERLQKVLASAGIASRRDCEELISAGRVAVNGRVITTLGARVDPSEDEVTIDGRAIDKISARTYVMLNKTPGVISTAEDTHDRPTVVEMVELPARLFPVGRLDKDSEGLLLLTDDGELTQRLTHPSYAVEKEYRALLDQPPSPDALRQWRAGVELDGQMTAPAWVDVQERADEGTWVSIVLREGRKRQIRDVARLLGYQVLRLIRVREGPLLLGDLASGAWRQLTDEEVSMLQKHAEESAIRMNDENERPRGRGRRTAESSGDDAPRAPARPRSDEQANDRPPRDDSRSYDSRPPRQDRGSYGDSRPPRQDRGSYGDSRPPRQDRGSYGDSRPPRQDDRGGSGDSRPPRQDDRGGSGDSRPPRRDDRPTYREERGYRGSGTGGGYRDSRPPRRDDRSYGDSRPPRQDRGGYSDSRPPRQDDRGGSGDSRPPRQDRGGYSDSRPPRRDDRPTYREERGYRGSGTGGGYRDSRPPRRDDRGYGDSRPPRQDDRGGSGDKPAPSREWHARQEQAEQARKQRSAPGSRGRGRFGGDMRGRTARPGGRADRPASRADRPPRPAPRPPRTESDKDETSE